MFWKKYKHKHLGYEFCRCILSMKKSYHNKLKTIWHLAITYATKRTHIMQLWTFAKTKSIYYTTCLLYDIYIYSQNTYRPLNIHIIITSVYLTILLHVNLLYKLQTVHQYIYFFLKKKYKNVHFSYQLLQVYASYEHIVLEIL